MTAVSNAEFLKALEARRALGVLRKCPKQHAKDIGQAAIDAGFDILEITLDSDDALGQIKTLVASRPHAIVGAGTVHTAAEVDQVAAVGARFVVSPMLSEAVVERALTLGLVPLPGVVTPTEMSRALTLGAPAVKWFPAAQSGGPSYIAAVLAPMRGIRIVPTGGVDASNAKQYLSAGAFAVGIGGSLFTTAALREGDVAAINHGVQLLLAAVAT